MWLLKFKSLLCFVQGVRPWTSCLTPLSFTLLICKLESVELIWGLNVPIHVNHVWWLTCPIAGTLYVFAPVMNLVLHPSVWTPITYIPNKWGRNAWILLQYHQGQGIYYEQLSTWRMGKANYLWGWNTHTYVFHSGVLHLSFGITQKESHLSSAG